MRSIKLVGQHIFRVSLLLLPLLVSPRVKCLPASVNSDSSNSQTTREPLKNDQGASLEAPKAGKILDYSSRHQQLKASSLIDTSHRHGDLARASPALHHLIAQSRLNKRKKGEEAPNEQQQGASRARIGIDGREKENSALQEQQQQATSSVQELSSSKSSPPLHQAKCVITTTKTSRKGGRSLRDLLSGAKNLLTGGLSSVEQRAGNIFWYGSNVLATLIPLASLLGLSGHSSSTRRPSLELANLTDQTNATTSATGKRIGFLPSPHELLVKVASLSAGGGNGLHGRVDHLMGWVERSIEHLPHFPRLHPQECMKRTICEAHAEPSKYGALGLTLRLLFPASQVSSTDGQDNMEYKVINKYRHAAGYGMARRVMDSQQQQQQQAAATTGNYSLGQSDHQYLASVACKEKYEDCLVSLLDVSQNLLDFFLAKS